MPLDISFYSGYDPITRLCYGKHIGASDIAAWAISGTSAVSPSAIPANAAVARLTAGEKCRYLKDVDNTNTGTQQATTTNGQLLLAGATIDVLVTGGKYFNAITVA